MEEYIDDTSDTKKTKINTDDSLIKVYIRLENMIDIYESSGYRLATMLSEIGGLASFLYAFTMVCTRFVAKDRLTGSLI